MFDYEDNKEDKFYETLDSYLQSHGVLIIGIFCALAVAFVFWDKALPVIQGLENTLAQVAK